MANFGTHDLFYRHPNMRSLTSVCFSHNGVKEFFSANFRTTEMNSSFKMRLNSKTIDQRSFDISCLMIKGQRSFDSKQHKAVTFYYKCPLRLTLTTVTKKERKTNHNKVRQWKWVVPFLNYGMVMIICAPIRSGEKVDILTLEIRHREKAEKYFSTLSCVPFWFRFSFWAILGLVFNNS